MYKATLQSTPTQWAIEEAIKDLGTRNEIGFNWRIVKAVLDKHAVAVEVKEQCIWILRLPSFASRPFPNTEPTRPTTKNTRYTNDILQKNIAEYRVNAFLDLFNALSENSCVSLHRGKVACIEAFHFAVVVSSFSFSHSPYRVNKNPRW